MKIFFVVLLLYLSQSLYSQTYFTTIKDATIKKSIENIILSPDFSGFHDDKFSSNEKTQLLSTYKFIWFFSRSVFDGDINNINFKKLDSLYIKSLEEINSNKSITKTKLKYFMDGLLGIAYAYSGSYWKANSISSDALEYFHNIINKDKNDFDSKLPVGLELYYKGNLPFLFRIFFPGGDIDKGMELISLSYNNGLFSNVFAGMLLYSFYFSNYYDNKNENTEKKLYDHILDFSMKYKSTRYLGNLVFFHNALNKSENSIINILDNIKNNLKYGFNYEISKAKGLYYFYSKKYNLAENYLEKSYNSCDSSQKINIAYYLALVSKELGNETKLQKYKMYIKENDKNKIYDKLINNL